MVHPLLQNSYGNRPEVVQDDVYPEGIVSMALADEARTLLLGLKSGQVVLLGPDGSQLKRARGITGLRFLSWSAAGNFGILALSGGKLVCVDADLATRWEVTLTGDVVGVAISPHGSHIAVSTESSFVHIVSIDKKEIGKFQTPRPIKFLEFLWEKPAILGAAEFGHLCRHQLDGTEDWNERIMNNVGNMALTADGNHILLSAFNHGVQVLSADGKQQGAYMVDGIPDYVSVAANGRRLAARTVEHRIYWLNFDGDVSWGCDFASDPPCQLAAGPLGDRLYMSTESGRLVQLVW